MKGPRRLRAILRLGWLLFLRDFRLRYRQTFFGSLWAVGRVLATGLPLILVGNQFGLGQGHPGNYPLFALVGIVVWQVFWDSVMSPQQVARRMRKMMAEVNFPREAVIAAGAGYVLFHAGVYLVLIAATFAIFRVAPPATLPLGIVTLPALVVAGLSIGMLFVPLTFVYLDFRYGLPFLSTALLWTAPVFYVSPAEGMLHTLNTLNPLTYLIEGPRQWIVAGSTGHGLAFAVTALGFAGVFVLSLRFYRRAMPLAIERLLQR